MMNRTSWTPCDGCCATCGKNGTRNSSLNAGEALDSAERLAAFDVVVSDMRMPGMDGAQLLEQVRRRSPATVRIVLSGHCDREAVMRTVKVAHQFLTKPCDSEDIKATVMRACRLADRLSDPWHRELVSRVTSVPSSLSAHLQLAAELEAAEPSVDRVGEIVARDVGATAKLLQLVSSSFFGSPRASSDPAHWAGWLGIDTVKLLVLREGAVHALRGRRRGGFFPGDLDRAQPSGGQVAKALMESEAASTTQIDHAYLAGLLHDVGLFILAEHLPERRGAGMDLLAEHEGIGLGNRTRQFWSDARRHRRLSPGTCGGPPTPSWKQPLFITPLPCLPRRPLGSSRRSTWQMPWPTRQTWASRSVPRLSTWSTWRESAARNDCRDGANSVTQSSPEEVLS